MIAGRADWLGYRLGLKTPIDLTLTLGVPMKDLGTTTLVTVLNILTLPVSQGDSDE